MSRTVKTGEHVKISFAISVCYSLDVKYKKSEYFCDRVEVCLDVFVGKMNKVLSDLPSWKKTNEFNKWRKRIYLNEVMC